MRNLERKSFLWWGIKETRVMRKLPRMHCRFFVFKVLWDVNEYFYGCIFPYHTEMLFCNPLLWFYHLWHQDALISSAAIESPKFGPHLFIPLISIMAHDCIASWNSAFFSFLVTHLPSDSASICLSGFHQVVWLIYGLNGPYRIVRSLSYSILQSYSVSDGHDAYRLLIFIFLLIFVSVSDHIVYVSSTFLIVFFG